MTSPTADERASFRNVDALVGTVLVLWIGMFVAVRELAVADGGVLLAWDVAWYAEVAKSGYSFNGDPSTQQTVAFLPVYPALLKFFLACGVDKEAIVRWLPIVLTVPAMVLLGRVLEFLVGQRRALWTMVLFVASPFSLYFLNGYSESLYLLTLAGCLYFLVVRRNLLACAVIAGVATALRPHALILFPFCMMWEWSMRSGPKAASRTLVRFGMLAPVFGFGFLAVGIYYWWMFGDSFLYKNIMVAWGFDQYSDGPGSVIDHFLAQIRLLSHLQWSLLRVPMAIEYAKLLLLASIIGTGIAFCIFKEHRKILLYGVLLIAFALVVTEGSVNLGRHLVTNFAFPLALVLLVDRVLSIRSGGMIRHEPNLAAAGFVLIAVVGLVLQMRFAWSFYRMAWVS